MKGTAMISSKGVYGKWPGGQIVTFTIADVAAFGKQRRYNDFVTRFLARLRTGEEVMIDTDGRTDEDQRWLRKMSKRVPFGGVTSHDCPEITTWIELDNADGQPQPADPRKP